MLMGLRGLPKYLLISYSILAKIYTPDCNPGMCPDWELNQKPFGSQAGTQFTEPHQPGKNNVLTGTKVKLEVGENVVVHFYYFLIYLILCT